MESEQCMFQFGFLAMLLFAVATGSGYCAFPFPFNVTA
jgi:hypothetical protein